MAMPAMPMPPPIAMGTMLLFGGAASCIIGWYTSCATGGGGGGSGSGSGSGSGTMVGVMASSSTSCPSRSSNASAFWDLGAATMVLLRAESDEIDVSLSASGDTRVRRNARFLEHQARRAETDQTRMTGRQAAGDWTAGTRRGVAGGRSPWRGSGAARWRRALTRGISHGGAGGAGRLPGRLPAPRRSRRAKRAKRAEWRSGAQARRAVKSRQCRGSLPGARLPVLPEPRAQYQVCLVHVQAPIHLELQRVHAVLGSTELSHEFAAAVGVVEADAESRRSVAAEGGEGPALELGAAGAALEGAEDEVARDAAGIEWASSRTAKPKRARRRASSSARAAW
jgi:hypothetical protein